MANETRIKIKVPNPPANSTIAKIIIEKYYGVQKKESEEEVYFDYVESCKDIITPELGDIPKVTLTNISLAYDQCQENIADLFCAPPEVPPIQSGQPVPEIRNFNVNKEFLYPGEEIQINFSLSGKGYYSIFQRFFNDHSEKIGNDIVLANFLEFSAPPETQVEKAQIISVPTNLEEDIVFAEYILTVTNNNDTEDSRKQTVSIKRRPPLQEETIEKKFEPDNDVSDAKKEIYYLASNVIKPSLTLSDYSISNLKNDTKKFNSDLIRENAGAFWILNDEETNLTFAKDANQAGKIIVLQDSKVTSNNIKPATANDTDGFGNTTENIQYQFTDNIVGIERLRYKDNIISKNYILDMAYSYQKPYLKKELKKAGALAFNSAKISLTPTYNYFNQKYEQLHNSIDENILPNIYFLNLNKEAVQNRRTAKPEDDFTIDPDIRKLIVLNDQIPEKVNVQASERRLVTPQNTTVVNNRVTQPFGRLTTTQNIRAENNRVAQSVVAINSNISSEPFETKMYYDYYLKEAKKQRINDANLLNRIKNTYIPYAFVNKMQKYNADSVMHPMKIEVSFSKPKISIISSLLKASKIGEQFMLSCLTKFQKNETATIETVKQEFDLLTSGYFENTNRYIEINNITSLTGSITDEFVYLGDYRQFNNSQTGTQLNMLEFADFSDRLHYIIKQQLRTYSDILNGKKCFTETLYYRIEKKSVDNDAVIQNIWIPNDPDMETINYIDTQVKYDKKYTYTIYSYDFVLANSYKSLDQPATIGTINISNKPLLLLVENIFDRVSATVVDLPPNKPSVEIYPYRGVDNKITFLLNRNIGTTKQKEIIIENEDFDFFEKIRDSQQNEQEDLIQFSSDDIIKEYEIFRMDKPPIAYQDFAGTLHGKVDTKVNSIEPNKRATLVSFTDFIVPNKKYYYTFRCKDIHEHLSNPSEIYEVEIVNENGTIFLLSKIYEPKRHLAVEASKSFNRFLMIKPNMAQEVDFDFEAETAKNAAELKSEVESRINKNQDRFVWNKKYKLRLVSKSTNRVYDINFKFGTETKIVE